MFAGKAALGVLATLGWQLEQIHCMTEDEAAPSEVTRLARVRAQGTAGQQEWVSGHRPQPPPTWMYFMNRWHFPQRERGLPVAARGEKDTSISSSMPERK